MTTLKTCGRGNKARGNRIRTFTKDSKIGKTMRDTMLIMAKTVGLIKIKALLKITIRKEASQGSTRPNGTNISRIKLIQKSKDIRTERVKIILPDTQISLHPTANKGLASIKNTLSGQIIKKTKRAAIRLKISILNRFITI
jgi:hypothetical protein